MTKVKNDSLDEQYVRIIDKEHQKYGFFGLAQYEPSTGLYDVIDEDEVRMRIIEVVEGLRLEQLKAA